MKWQSVLAIYVLVWTLCLFVVLPIGVRTHEEAGEERGKGHADSAPVQHDLWRKALWATLLAAVVTALFYFNYVYGWLTLDNMPVPRPPDFR